MTNAHLGCAWEKLKNAVFFFFLLLSYFCYVLTYFYHYSQVSLYFLVLFISRTVLFYLPFNFIYRTFSKKILVLIK